MKIPGFEDALIISALQNMQRNEKRDTSTGTLQLVTVASTTTS